MARTGLARCIKAGEVRQGSEAKGNAGRVEVRQAWNEVEGSDTEGTESEGTEMQVRKGRSVKERRESRGRHGVGAAVGTVLD